MSAARLPTYFARVDRDIARSENARAEQRRRIACQCLFRTAVRLRKSGGVDLAGREVRLPRWLLRRARDLELVGVPDLRVIASRGRDTR